MPKQSSSKNRYSGPVLRPYRRRIGPSGVDNPMKNPNNQVRELQLLNNYLETRRNVVVISGAGISTSAGIDDFRSSSKTKMSSRTVFDLSAYSSIEYAELLHKSETNIFETALEQPEPTPFEYFMEELAKSGRLHRHYTQNIDCRTHRLVSLSQKTINLHGRLDRMRCHIYSQHILSAEKGSFQALLHNRCPICDEKNDERLAKGKRPHSVGFLRPDVLLYNECDGSDPQIVTTFQHDLRHRSIDAVIIVGTTLHIPHLVRFTTELCKQMKSRRKDGIVIWVSKEPPRLEKGLKSLIDFEYIGECDRFASQLFR